MRLAIDFPSGRWGQTATPSFAQRNTDPATGIATPTSHVVPEGFEGTALTDQDSVNVLTDQDGTFGLTERTV